MIYQFITKNRVKNLSLKKTCRIFLVSPSGYFKSLKLKENSKQQKKEKIIRAFKLHKGRYGYRKIYHYLSQNKEFAFSACQVRYTLKESGLKARKARLFKAISTQSDESCPAIERVFRIGETVPTAVNQVWGSDITYLKAAGGHFLYLAIFLDFYSRKVVGWDISSSLSAAVVLRAFYAAVKTRGVKEGLIVHSDRGVYIRRIQEKVKRIGFYSIFIPPGELL